jgi:hypothetical protein
MMTMRVDEKGVRFRVSPDDLENLLNGRTLARRLDIGAGAVEFRIVPVNAGDIHLDVDGKRFTLSVSRFALEELKSMGRSAEGISARQGEAEVSLQVDMKATIHKIA